MVDAFFKWVDQESLSVPPRSALGRAFSHAQRNGENFYHYLTILEAALSNNLAENAIRPFVVGRKNWFFSGSP